MIGMVDYFFDKPVWFRPIVTGSTTSVTFKLTSGTFPAGIQSNTSGVIYGTVTERGSFPITMIAYNDVSEMSWSITIRSGAGTYLQSTNMTSELNGIMYLQIGKYYDLYCIFTGDITNVIFDNIYSLEGMTWNSTIQDDGSWKLTLYGTPTTVQNVRIRALASGLSTLAVWFNVHVEELRSITIFNYPESEYEIYNNVYVNIPCDCDGNFITYTYTNLPTGMSIDSSGSIIGIPTVTGTYDSVVTATNESDSMSASVSIIITDRIYSEDSYVFSTPNILITPVNNNIFTTGTWTVNGLPSDFIDSSGVISGSITKLNGIVTATITNNDSSLSQNIKVKVILKCYLQENKFDL